MIDTHRNTTQDSDMSHKPFDRRAQFVHPVTEASIRAAITAADLEREDQIRRLDGHEAVYRLVQDHGADRVYRWLKTAAGILGQEIK